MKKYIFSLVVLLFASTVWGATVLTVPQGGTGASTFGAGLCLKGNGTGAITTGACGGSQTPWTQNINGAGFNLNNISSLGIATATPTALLSIDATSSNYLPLFYIASSSANLGTTTSFYIGNNGINSIG